jgi:hypothetical protein
MNKGRVGEDRGSKETDGCPLTAMNTFPVGLNTLSSTDPGDSEWYQSCLLGCEWQHKIWHSAVH